MITGLRKTYHAVISANGPAQHIVYSVWGILLAGMYYDVCPVHIPNVFIVEWGAMSVVVLLATVWLPKAILKAALIIDMLLCAAILALFVSHPEHSQGFTYMTHTATGIVTAQREQSQGMTVSEEFHIISLLWCVLHGAYLANLVQRQQLERSRFDGRI